MRKLLLVLFLCSLASNALAKVEMWDCGNSMELGIFLNKIKLDTSIPAIYIRSPYQEFPELEEELGVYDGWMNVITMFMQDDPKSKPTVKYSKKNDTLILYADEKPIWIYDLIFSSFKMSGSFVEKGARSEFSCKVIGK